MHNRILDLCKSAGAVAVGIANAGDVDNRHQEIFYRWLANDYCAGMEYMRNHAALRINPRYLLDDAKSLIVTAFSYSQPILRDNLLPLIAPYAYGKDYHRVLKKRLKPIVQLLSSEGYNSRICIDSAPIPERYWAQRAGIGSVCDNGMLYVPGHGQEVFLALILTTADLPQLNWIKKIKYEETESNCTHCGKCAASCPTGALMSDGCVDSRKCINYLTIEHHGYYDNAQRQTLEKANSHRPAGFWVGCDICQRTCPLNEGIEKTEISEFLPKPEFMTMTPDKFEKFSDKEKEEFLSASPLRRALKP